MLRFHPGSHLARTDFQLGDLLADVHPVLVCHFAHLGEGHRWMTGLQQQWSSLQPRLRLRGGPTHLANPLVQLDERLLELQNCHSLSAVLDRGEA